MFVFAWLLEIACKQNILPLTVWDFMRNAISTLRWALNGAIGEIGSKNPHQGLAAERDGCNPLMPCRV